jgi:hypothetical protein
MSRKRTALLVRCSAAEAAAIREAAKHERRTISDCILHAVLGRIAHQRELEQEWRKNGLRVRVPINETSSSPRRRPRRAALKNDGP